MCGDPRDRFGYAAGQARMNGSQRARSVAAAMVGVGAIVLILAFLPGAARLHYEQFALVKELVLPIATLVPAAIVLWGARRITVTAIDALVLVGLLLAVASVFGHDTSSALSWRGLVVAASSTAAFLVARTTRDDPRLPMLLAIAVAIGAVTAVAEIYGLVSISMPGRAPGGTEGNRNFMAHALVVGLPALLVPCLRDERPLIRRLALAGVMLAVLAVIASRSRTAWLGLAVLVLVAIAAWAWAGVLRSQRRRSALVGAALLAGVLVAVLVPDRLHWTEPRPYWSTLSSITDHASGTGRGRMIQYRTTLDIIAAHPLLGVGAGNWSREYPAHATPPDPSFRPRALQPVNRLPNSDWLGIAAERGIVALVALVALFVLLARGWIRAVRSAEAALWPGAALAMASALAVMGVFDAVLLRATPAMLAFALLGMASLPGRALTLPNTRVTAIAVIVVAGLFTADAGRRLRAHQIAQPDTASLQSAVDVDPTAFQLRTNLVYRLYEEGRCTEMLEHAERVTRDYPHLPALRPLLENCRRGAR
jgi:O-antigen ligase